MSTLLASLLPLQVSKIGVFSCGPRPLTKSVMSACDDVNKARKLPYFIHHFENFGWESQLVNFTLNYLILNAYRSHPKSNTNKILCKRSVLNQCLYLIKIYVIHLFINQNVTMLYNCVESWRLTIQIKKFICHRCSIHRRWRIILKSQLTRFA